MKKYVVTLLLIACATVYSQVEKVGTPQKLTTAEKTEVLYNRLTRGLTITSEQKEKIHPLVEKIVQNREAYIADLKSKKDNGALKTKEQLAEFRQKRDAEENQFKEEMKKILTPEQFKVFEENLRPKRKKLPESGNELVEPTKDVKP
jgi:Spy/CpxP family protein refolding chaperone